MKNYAIMCTFIVRNKVEHGNKILGDCKTGTGVVTGTASNLVFQELLKP